MNIIKIALCISVFLFSHTAFALGNQENSKLGVYNQMPAMNQVAFHQENQVSTLVATDAVHHHVMTQSPIENREVSFFTKLCILIIISMVYWIYWLINTWTYKMKP
jgi:hypothetical protein